MIQSNSKRSAFLIGIAAFVLTLLYLHSVRSPSWRAVPQVVGLGDLVQDEEASRDGANEDVKGNSYPNTNKEESINLADQFASPFVPGSAKPPGSNYTRNLVVAKTKDEEAGWLDTEDIGDVTKMVYTVDDGQAPLHPPMNKGHEVMVYLTYIIDQYHDLPDVSIFMHSHQYAWHENDLLGYNAAEMVKRLSSERVQRQGYMNLRCHWTPGCPDWMHPGTLEQDPYKQEEAEMAHAWAELFPERPIPEVLAQPCCAQFALSSQRIHAVTRDKYIFYREWLIRTKLEDKISGRIWEYIWQVVFTGESVFCPNQWACYCDGYGVCFESEGAFDYWFELRYKLREMDTELKQWKEKADKLEEYLKHGKLTEGTAIEIPEVGRNTELTSEMEKLQAVMEDGRRKAMKRERTPRSERRVRGEVGVRATGIEPC